MDNLEILDIYPNEKKEKITNFKNQLIEKAKNSDFDFLLIAYSKSDDINIVAGAGSSPRLEIFIKQAKKRIKKL